MNDDRRNQENKSARRSDNPLNAITDMLAAAWGTAVGIGCAVFGIKRPGEERGAERAAGPLPERPETSSGERAQPGKPGGGEAKPEPSSKVSPIRKETGREPTTGAQTQRRGARQTPPAKQGTAASAPGRSDKGGSQRPAGQQRGRSAAGRSGTARSAPRPKASDKHPAQPRPGQAAREEAPASKGPPAMAPAGGAEPQRPPALGRPRGGKADDLKQITGIGPKLEEKLNGLGIYHYDQIAGWGDSDIAWIDAELQAKGRVERDNWVGQAAALMSGAKSGGGGPAT